MMISSYLQNLCLLKNNIVSEKFDVDFSISLTSLMYLYKYVIIVIVFLSIPFFISVPITFAESLQNTSSSSIINSTEAEMLCNKASVLYNQQKYDEALEYYNKVLEIDPSNLYSLNSIGNIFVNIEQYDKAIEYLEKVLAIDPENVDALKNQAIILRELKR